MPKGKEVCTWCHGAGWIIIYKRGQIVRREMCKKCHGTGKA